MSLIMQKKHHTIERTFIVFNLSEPDNVLDLLGDGACTTGTTEPGMQFPVFRLLGHHALNENVTLNS